MKNRHTGDTLPLVPQSLVPGADLANLTLTTGTSCLLLYQRSSSEATKGRSVANVSATPRWAQAASLKSIYDAMGIIRDNCSGKVTSSRCLNYIVLNYLALIEHITYCTAKFRKFTPRHNL